MPINMADRVKKKISYFNLLKKNLIIKFGKSFLYVQIFSANENIFAINIPNYIGT